MQVLVIGIDVGKDTLCVCVQAKGQDRPLGRPVEVANTLKGWSVLVEQLQNLQTQHGAQRIEVYLEATGVYGDRLCRALYGVENVTVHVVSPDRLAHYLRAMGNRGKTDALDARGIARFGAHHDWRAWSPKSPVVDQLRHLLQTLEGLKQMLRQTGNRIHADELRGQCHPAALKAQKQLCDGMKRQVTKLQKEAVKLIRSDERLQESRELLLTIPGVGPETVLAVLAMIGDDMPTDRKQWVSYVGLAPRPHESGTSVRGQAAVSPSRGRAIRKMLYMGVLQAFRCNPYLKAFYDQLIARGKPAKVALTACMRKQLHIIYGVLKNQAPFDLSKLQPA